MLPALWRLVRRSPRIAVATVLGAALLGLLWLSSRPAPPGGAAGGGAGSGGSRLLTPEVELRGVVRQLQEDNAVLRKSLEDVTRTLQEMKDRKPSGTDGALSAKELDRLRRELGPLPLPPAAAVTPVPPPPPPAPVVVPAPAVPEPRRITVFTVGTAGAGRRDSAQPVGPPPRGELREGDAAVRRLRADPPAAAASGARPLHGGAGRAERDPRAASWMRGRRPGARRLHDPPRRAPARHAELRSARPGAPSAAP